MNKTVVLRVFRYTPSVSDDAPGHGHGPRTERFEVPFGDATSVADALDWIKDNADPSLAYRVSCRMAVCGSCGVMVDGKPSLACETFLRDLGPEVTIEPLANLDVERDLVVDVEPYQAALAAVKPWLVSAKEVEPKEVEPVETSATNVQTPGQMLDFTDFAQCIGCLLCYAACPQVGFERDFLGPAAITAATRANRDSRDHGIGQRAAVLDAVGGVWPCTFVGACSLVCPKGADPASAVQLAKLTSAASRAKEFLTGKEGT